MIESDTQRSSRSALTADGSIIRVVAGDVRLLGQRWQSCVRSGARRKVHAVRVATRRLDALLELIGAGLPSSLVGESRASLREVLRALGGLRDAEVQRCEMSRLLAGQSPDGEKVPPGLREAPGQLVSPREREQLQRVFAHREERCRREAVKALKAADPRKTLARMVADLRERSRKTSLSASLRRAARSVVERSARELVSRWPSDFEDPIAYHRARLAVKRCRYALESAQRLGWAAPRGLGRLQAAQERLGRLHDCELLQARLTKLVARQRIAPVVRHALGPLIDWQARELRPGRGLGPPIQRQRRVRS